MEILSFDISKLTEEDYLKFYENSTIQRKAKADRLKFSDDKKRCIIGEVLLKKALSLYFEKNKIIKDIDLKSFEIKNNKYGKPYIKNLNDFYYNISHSGKYVVLAFGEKDVGVDVEYIDCGRDEVSLINLAKRYFTEKEKRYVFEDSSLMYNRFYEIWTGKESYLKCIGKGICAGLDSVDVTELWKNGLETRLLDEDYCISLFEKK